MAKQMSFKVRGWESPAEGLLPFLFRTFQETIFRLCDAVSFAWFQEQIMHFKIKRYGSQYLHGKIVKPIHTALMKSGLFDVFVTQSNIEVSFQLNNQQFLNLKKNSLYIVAEFTFRTGPRFKTYTIKFDSHNNSLGDILSTAVGFHYCGSSSGGGGGFPFPERMVSQLVDLLLAKPQTSDIHILRVEYK